MLHERDIQCNITGMQTSQCCGQVLRLIGEYDYTRGNDCYKDSQEKTKKRVATAITTSIWEEAERLRKQHNEDNTKYKRTKSEDTGTGEEENADHQKQTNQTRSSSMKQRSDATKNQQEECPSASGTRTRKDLPLSKCYNKTLRQK